MLVCPCYEVYVYSRPDQILFPRLLAVSFRSADMSAARGLPGLPSWFVCLTLAFAIPAPCFGQLEKAGFCRVPDADLRIVLGNFTRDLTQPFSATMEGSGGAVPTAEREANCSIVSYHASFDELLGSSWELRELGPIATYNFAEDGGTFLPGALK